MFTLIDVFQCTAHYLELTYSYNNIIGIGNKGFMIDSFFMFEFQITFNYVMCYCQDKSLNYALPCVQ